MELSEAFEVAAPPQQVWSFLLDLERVTPCMPGAELSDLPDERTWKGQMKVKLGAVSLTYAATVVVDEADEASGAVVLKARGRETRGKGTANATVDARVLPAGEGTAVALEVDLRVSGPVAQYGRGMIADVSKRLTGEFAERLRERISSAAAP